MWKHSDYDLYYIREIVVSEELSSVETSQHYRYNSTPIKVSEELSSVETQLVVSTDNRIDRVSEELSSVETLVIFLVKEAIYHSFRRT